ERELRGSDSYRCATASVAIREREELRPRTRRESARRRARGRGGLSRAPCLELPAAVAEVEDRGVSGHELPGEDRMASLFSRRRWMARLSGRAPYSGSQPSSA